LFIWIRLSPEETAGEGSVRANRRIQEKIEARKILKSRARFRGVFELPLGPGIKMSGGFSGGEAK